VVFSLICDGLKIIMHGVVSFQAGENVISVVPLLDELEIVKMHVSPICCACGKNLEHHQKEKKKEVNDSFPDSLCKGVERLVSFTHITVNKNENHCIHFPDDRAG